MNAMKEMVRFRGVIVGLAVCFICATTAGEQLGKPSDVHPGSEWTVEYTESGGIVGRVERISVRQDGVTEIWGLITNGMQKSMLSSDELQRINSLVKSCKFSPLPKLTRSPMPDVISSELTVEFGGHLYYVGLEGKELAQELHRIYEQKAQEAENARWVKAGPFQLGRCWDVKEEVRDRKGQFHGDYWLGTWTHRDHTNLFDALWRDSKSGEEVKGVMQFDSAERGIVSLHRLGTKEIYQGFYRAEEMKVIHFGSINAPGQAQRAWWATVKE